MDRKTMRALTDEEVREKRGRKNFDLDKAIEAMLQYKAEGKSVSYRFNGFKLESDKISPDSVEKVKEEYRNTPLSHLPRELYAEEMRDMALRFRPGNFNLEQAVEAMLRYKEKGESVYYIFNGFELNSDEISTIEKTKEMYDLFIKEENMQNASISIKKAIENALAAGISTNEINEIVSNEIDNEKKVDKALKMLYPNYEQIKNDKKVQRNKDFISENIEEIEKGYNELVALGQFVGGKVAIEASINDIKSEKYIKMLYPNLGETKIEDKLKVIRNMRFIRENTEEIEDAYYEAVELGATEGTQETIEATVNKVKEEKTKPDKGFKDGLQVNNQKNEMEKKALESLKPTKEHEEEKER